MKSTDLFPGFSFIPGSQFSEWNSDAGRYRSIYRLLPEGEDKSGCRIKTLSLKLEELHHPGKERISEVLTLESEPDKNDS